MQVTVKDIESNTGKILAMVAKGEKITITQNGKPRAKLIPFENNLGNEDELFGIWADHKDSEDVNAYVQNVRKGCKNFDNIEDLLAELETE